MKALYVELWSVMGVGSGAVRAERVIRFGDGRVAYNVKE